MTVSCMRPALSENPYAVEIDAVLPRLLALGDTDGLRPTRGLLDRQYWSWKLIDFPNASFQGATNGLSVLLATDALADHLSRQSILQRIVDMFAATSGITRSNGSLEEAFPFEQSYCVTAAVAFDLLKALDHAPVRLAVGDDLTDRVISPLSRFLVRADETHGMISNHLATAAAALYRWHERVGDLAAKRKADLLIERILAHQSEEGWMSEYGGADPGYQTLCLTYLADIVGRPGAPAALAPAVGRCLGFLEHFVHPDGSFGGIYGSRATRIYYPGGVAALSAKYPSAARIDARMRRSIEAMSTVPLRAIDQSNLVPMFNSYARALAATPVSPPVAESATAPIGRHMFPQGGLLVDIGPQHHTVISVRKGGVAYHWSKGEPALIDTGIVVEDVRGVLATSQADDFRNTIRVAGDVVEISGRLRRLEHPLPGPWRFAALRILAATVLRFPALNAWIKQILVRYLISGQRADVGGFTRTINLGPRLSIADRWDNSTTLARRQSGPFTAIHMASQGYWQVQDDAGGEQ